MYVFNVLPVKNIWTKKSQNQPHYTFKGNLTFIKSMGFDNYILRLEYLINFCGVLLLFFGFC